MRELVPEDMTFTHMSGRQQTREEYFADVEDGSLRYFTIGIDSPVVEVDGDTALFILHHVLNFSWYRNLFRGHYSASRILRTIADLFLIPVMLALPVSGIMMSRHIFSGLGGSLSFARTSHLFASYWGFVLMSLHIGLHWRMAVGMAGNLWGRMKMGRGGILLLRVVFIFIALYGVYAFVRRQM